jgi:TolA-binding protein
MNVHFLIIIFLLAGVWPAQAGQKAFFVQAINTENRTKAESIKESLKRFGNVHIDQQGDHFIVQIGPIKDGKKAISVRNIVKKTHLDAFIRVSDSRPVTGRAATPAPVSEPQSTVPVAVAQAAPPVEPDATPKNQDKVDQLPLAGVQPAQAGQKAFSVQTINSESRAKTENGKINLNRLKIVHAAPVPVAAPIPVAAVPVADNQETRQSEIALKTAEPPAVITAPDMLMKEAVDHYQSQRLESALEKFSLFLSLYPRNSNAPSAMLAVAGILLEMKRPLSALRIYSRILERYPETPVAIESVVALADMSMLSPGLKPSIAITGAQWYLDPVSAYDAVLSKNPPAELTERLLLQRIAALRLKGRYREAYDAGNQFLERYPQTKQQYALLRALRSDIAYMIEERIAAGDDVAVISLILNARRKGLIRMTDTDVLIKAAGSYVRLEMPEEARSLLNSARPFAAVQTPQIDAALEELTRGRRIPLIPSAAADRWALYHVGRQQVLSSNLSAAEKTFTQMKGNDQDAFWAKLADFTLKDGIWAVKYQDYLKK